MQRIIQIIIAGRLIPIEEDAYTILKDYISSLERIFANEAGKDEIIQDIEYRIAELFGIGLQNGAPAIDRNDVTKVVETLGTPADLLDGTAGSGTHPKTNTLPVPYVPPRQQYKHSQRRLFRNPNDKILGGVCSGVANYFDIDPVIVRLVFAALVLGLGIGVLVYIVAWIVIPLPRTPQEMAEMSGGDPMNFYTMKQNMGSELQDLKKRGEEMSRELRDFFSKKK